MFRGDFMKYAAAYAPYLALLLLAQFAAEVTMHSYMQLLLICIPCYTLAVALLFLFMLIRWSKKAMYKTNSCLLLVLPSSCLSLHR